MPNIATLLKEEIVRLARKEARKELEGLRKASAQYRTDIAQLKRQMASLSMQQAKIEKIGRKKVVPNAVVEAATKFRFSAKRFAAQRAKLGISAADMGTLVGVSTQTIYHWESGKSRPRQQQLAAIAAVRNMGKRDIQACLESKAK